MTNQPISRGHHFIPQCYLNGFIDPKQQGNKLYVIDKIEKKQYGPIETEKVGKQRDFNRVDIEGIDIDKFEKSFSKFEGDVAKALDWIKNNRDIPEGEYYILILNLIALLSVRNPQTRRYIQEAQTQVLKVMSQMIVSSPELYDSYIQKIKESGKDIPDDVTFEDFKDYIDKDRYDIQYEYGYNLNLELHAIDNLLPYLFKRNWSLLIVSENAGYFVCSDYPVSILQKTKHGSCLNSTGYGLANTEVVFPINKEMAFSGIFDGTSRVIEVNEEIVAGINGRTVQLAERQIYSSEKRFKYLTFNGIELSDNLFN